MFVPPTPSRHYASVFGAWWLVRFGLSNQELHWVLKALMDRHPVRVVSALGNPLLTQRQEQIVRMVVEGLPNGEISSKLHVSPHTVKNHLFRIYEKLGVSSRVELILYAMSRSKGS